MPSGRRLALRLCTLGLLIAIATAGHAVVPRLSVQPARPTNRAPIDITVALLCARFETPVVAEKVITVAAEPTVCPPPPPQLPMTPPTIATFAVGPLAIGTYTVNLTFGGFLHDSLPVVVTEPTTEALLGAGPERFQVTLRWHDPRVGSGDAFAQQLTIDSASFWFFDASNAEVTVKVLDGRAVNGHYWVFIASMTDVGFDLHVTKTGAECPLGGQFPCPPRTYSNAPSTNRNFIDVEAF